MTRELPSFLRDMLSAPPLAGDGVHVWLYRVARNLHAHLTANEIVTLLEGRQYLTCAAISEFTRRAETGEFAAEHKVPRKTAASIR
jgi:hypothetical protein